MKKNINDKFKRELLFGTGAIVFIVLMTVMAVKNVHRREDLALLQMDFTDVITKAKICFDQGGVVQDPSQGQEGKVFVCSDQEVVDDIFPILQKISRRNFKYNYISSEKCFSKRCPKKGGSGNQGGRINIGRGNKLLLSCNVSEGICQIQ